MSPGGKWAQVENHNIRQLMISNLGLVAELTGLLSHIRPASHHWVAYVLSCVWLFETPWAVAHQAQAKTTGVGCHFLLQGIFPTQGWNLLSVSPSLRADPLPHCTTLEANHWREGPNIHPWTVMGLSCSCRNLINFSSSWRVREGRPSGSAPVVRMQPCEAVGTGCPAEGWSGADTSSATQVQVAPAPQKGTFFWFTQKQDLGQQQPCRVASSHRIPLLQVCQLMHLIQEVILLCRWELAKPGCFVIEENAKFEIALWNIYFPQPPKHAYVYWCVCVCVCALRRFSHVQFCATSWTAALQAPLFIGFFR